MLSVINRKIVSKGIGASVRFYGSQSSSGKKQTQKQVVNVPGLSEKCVAVPSGPVGPGAAKDKEYKNPEYFCYHEMSFAEAEIEMAKFRLPAPSNKRKFVP